MIVHAQCYGTTTQYVPNTGITRGRYREFLAELDFIIPARCDRLSHEKEGRMIDNGQWDMGERAKG